MKNIFFLLYLTISVVVAKDYSFTEVLSLDPISDWRSGIHKKNVERKQCRTDRKNVDNNTYQLTRVLTSPDVKEINRKDLAKSYLYRLQRSLKSYEKSCYTSKGNTHEYKDILKSGYKIIGTAKLKGLIY